MSPRDAGDENKDIRQRAKDFLRHGVLGCCPELKAAIGKTVGEAGAPKQPEKKLPKVVNKNGKRFDPKAKYGPGMVLSLFPSRSSQAALHGQPNFGWVEDTSPKTDEEAASRGVEALRQLANGPRVVQEVYEVDENGNPTKRVDDSGDDGEGDDDEEEDGGLEGKGLGRTLRELNPGNTLVARAAKKFGVWVDGLGKFRCPPGTPQANQYTDEMGSTCFSVSASELANAAQEGFASLSRWMQRRRQWNVPLGIDEFGNVEERVEVLEGRQAYKRVFTGSRARVRARMGELEGTIGDMLRIAGIPPDTSDNKDLVMLIRKLNPKIVLKKVGEAGENFDKLTPDQKRSLQAMGITRQSLVDAERGFLMRITELAITDPDRFDRIGVIVQDMGHPDEGFTKVLKNPGSDFLKDARYGITYNPKKMTETVVRQVKEVERNQRLGLRVEGAASDEEAADLLHEFVVNEDQWAGGMTASLAGDKNRFLAKGMHTGSHEYSHTLQVDAFIAEAQRRYGDDVKFSDIDNENIVSVMKNLEDDIDLEDLGLVTSDLDKIAFLGGKYGADQWRYSGAVDELWKIETTAELYALRDMGVIEGGDVDGVLDYMDDLKASKSRSERDARKKKNMKAFEARVTRPMERPDGARDTPDSAPPARRMTPARAKDAKAAARIGADIAKRNEGRFDKDEVDALARAGNTRGHDVFSLIDAEKMPDAIIGIDSANRLAKKHTAELDEIDVSGSTAVSRVAYDPKKEKLYVTYAGTEDKPGRTYRYDKVKPETVLDLHKAESKGKAINEIKRTHKASKPLPRIPERIDSSSLDDADIASQVQRNLIPVLTALDKSEVGRDLRVVISVKPDVGSGEIVDKAGITKARIYHDGIVMNDDEVVMQIPSNARGIPVAADVFDREEDGSMAILIMPPMRLTIVDGKGGRSAQMFEQRSSNETLDRMIEQWPEGSDPKQNRIISPAKNKVEQVVGTHQAITAGGDDLPDGSTAPLAQARIRTRNSDVHGRQVARGGAPTKPTKKYKDSVPSAKLRSAGPIETQEERNFSRASGHGKTISGLSSDGSVDPEITRAISDMDDRGVSRVIDAAANQFHEGVDRRPRLRVSVNEMGKIISDGGRHYKDQGHFSSLDRSYQAMIGIHPDTDDLDRPVSGYVVHPAQDLAARTAMRRGGAQVGNGPMEWPAGANPHGDVESDGDIEVVLKPEVSGRTAYGFGYGIDNKTRPVWLNSADPSAIADALVHIDPAADADESRNRALNAISAAADGNFGYFTDVGSPKPVATSQNQRTAAFAQRAAAHAKGSKPQRLGAQIMGGFVTEEIAEIRYPWSRVSGSSSDVDISDVVNKEPVSDRLRRLGFTDAEIEYFYEVNGDRSLDYISSSTMASLREYRKAAEIQKDLTGKGMPRVSFMHPTGFDPMDVSSYMTSPRASDTVEKALARAINEEVDELLEKMLKQVRKTRGKIWGAKPKVSVPA